MLIESIFDSFDTKAVMSTRLYAGAENMDVGEVMDEADGEESQSETRYLKKY